MRALSPGPVASGLLAVAIAAADPSSVSLASWLSPPADSIALWIEAAGDSTTYPDASQMIVFDRTDVEVEASGLGHVRRRTLTKILREEGARDQATLRLDYDPASNFIRVDEVRVHRAGSGTAEVDPSAIVDLPAPADLIYWGARMKLLSLPRLHVGDAVEVLTYKKGYQIAYLEEAPGADGEEERFIPPMRGHFYDVVTFQAAHPLREKTYHLRLPRDRPAQFAIYNGPLLTSATFSETTWDYAWKAVDVPAFEEEPRTPDATDLMPKVVLATVSGWPEKSRWFHEVNEAVFEPDEAILRVVDELTRGLRSDEEKMAALLHWVAQEIRYSGLSMGKGEGYTLHPGTMSFADRCGVCKDIAGMLVTMLRAAGYTTYPVMTNAGSRVEAIPADQFNHCVVAVQRADGGFTLLDPTWAPFDRSVWSRFEGEQHYVIGSPRGEGLSQIRPFRPEESLLTVEGSSRIDAQGNLAGELVLRGTGASDARLRGILAGARAGEAEEEVGRLFGRYGTSVEIRRLRATDPRDFSQDCAISFELHAAGVASAGDSALLFTPPVAHLLSTNARLCRLLAFTKEEDRDHAALLWFSQVVDGKETVVLPRGFRVSGGEECMEIDRPAASLEARLLPRGNRLESEIRAVVAKRTVPAGEWAGGAEAADSLRSFGARLRWAWRAS